MDNKKIREIGKDLLRIMALINVFYLVSYNIRNLASEYIFDAQILGLTNYDKTQYKLQAMAYSLLATIILMVTLALTKTKTVEEITHIPIRDHSSRNTRRNILFAMSSMALLIFYIVVQSTASSYEEVHKSTQANNILSKLLYFIIIYIGYELGTIISKGREPKTARRFIVMSVFIIMATGMRSFVIIYIMTIIVAYRINIVNLIKIAPIIFIFLIAAALFRSGGEITKDNTIIHVTMFLVGAASQVDLFYIGQYLDVGPRNVDAYFEEQLSSYFENGGGIGAFLPLELSAYMPSKIAMVVFIISPLMLLYISRYMQSWQGQLGIISFLIQYPIIIRNPLGSWINGYVVFTIILIYAYAKNSNRRHHI